MWRRLWRPRPHITVLPSMTSEMASKGFVAGSGLGVPSGPLAGGLGVAKGRTREEKRDVKADVIVAKICCMDETIRVSWSVWIAPLERATTGASPVEPLQTREDLSGRAAPTCLLFLCFIILDVIIVDGCSRENFHRAQHISMLFGYG
jgi:hypothetical protein